MNVLESACKRILLTRRAAVLLGIAVFPSVWGIILSRIELHSWKLSSREFEALSYSGAAAAIGTIVLLAGMWAFWLKCDCSSKRTRTLWFLALLFGLPYGAIPYYFFVYLPARRKILRKGLIQAIVSTPYPLSKRASLIGPFGRILAGGWGLLFLTTGMLFTFPKVISHLLGPTNLYVLLWLLVFTLAISTPIYAIVLLFRIGMKRSADSLPSTSPDLKGRNQP